MVFYNYREGLNSPFLRAAHALVLGAVVGSSEETHGGGWKRDSHFLVLSHISLHPKPQHVREAAVEITVPQQNATAGIRDEHVLLALMVNKRDQGEEIDCINFVVVIGIREHCLSS